MKINKKGFTLVELLAVIVILAIIALIATPIILNVIDEAREGAAKNSAYGYIDAVEKANVQKMYENQNINVLDGDYTISSDGKKVTKGSGDTAEEYDVNFKGTAPTAGTLKYNKGKLAKDSTITVSGKTFTVSDESGKLEKSTGSTGSDTTEG